MILLLFLKLVQHHKLFLPIFPSQLTHRLYTIQCQLHPTLGCKIATTAASFICTAAYAVGRILPSIHMASAHMGTCFAFIILYQRSSRTVVV